MAITRLMHMKEAPSYKPQHLVNAVKYILDVRNDGRKTDFGKWVGGNAGLDHREVIESFLNTKKAWNKEGGRQGYHFVISFPPKEADAQTCYNVIQDFCENYLRNEYDYVFAVHTDREHVHGHIIFNSVNRETGLKYRYEKGDWEISIQPITDEICKKYALAPLKIEKEKAGKHYASWLNEKAGTISWKHIMRADIDCAVHHSKSMSDFFRNMQQMNYRISSGGYSKKHNSNYAVYLYKDDKGIEHKHRSFSLTAGIGDAYNLESIQRRIEKGENQDSYHLKLSEELEQRTTQRLGYLSTSMKNTKTYRRMYQAVSFYKMPNPFAENYKTVRRDIVQLEKLIDECAYIKKNPLSGKSGYKKRLETVENKLKDLYIFRKSLYAVKERVEKEILPSDISRYYQLRKFLDDKKCSDDMWEGVQDELKELEERLPEIFMENAKALHQCNADIKILKKEKQILERVIKTEGDLLVQKNPEICMQPKKK